MSKTNETCLSFKKQISFDGTEDLFIANVLSCVLNLSFSLLTSLGNLLIIYAIGKTQDLHSASFILLGCLAASDLLVGLICQPVFVALKIAEIKRKNLTAYCTLRTFVTMFSWLTSAVSLFTLAAVSVDRLLCLHLHLRYNTLITVPRVFKAVSTLWTFTVALVTVRFLMGNEWFVITITVFLLSFLLISISTMRVFQIVRRHQLRIYDQSVAVNHLQLQTNNVNILKCRKSAVTILYIYGLFLIFYLPFFISLVIEVLVGYTKSVKVAYTYTATVVFINSFVNPLVYCWRIGEIRRAVKNILTREWLNIIKLAKLLTTAGTLMIWYCGVQWEPWLFREVDN